MNRIDSRLLESYLEEACSRNKQYNLPVQAEVFVFFDSFIRSKKITGNIIKALLVNLLFGVTSNSHIVFISDCLSGKVSAQQIIENATYYDKYPLKFKEFYQ